MNKHGHWIYNIVFFCPLPILSMVLGCLHDWLIVEINVDTWSSMNFWMVYIYIYKHHMVSNTLHYITLHYITLHYITLHYITLHTTLHYTTLHYTTLHYITLHYITLHYITHICIYIYIYIYMCIIIHTIHGRSGQWNGGWTTKGSLNKNKAQPRPASRSALGECAMPSGETAWMGRMDPIRKGTKNYHISTLW